MCEYEFGHYADAEEIVVILVVERSLCSATCVCCKRGTTHICCCAPCCCGAGCAAVDISYRLGPQQQTHCMLLQQAMGDRQTVCFVDPAPRTMQSVPIICGLADCVIGTCIWKYWHTCMADAWCLLCDGFMKFFQCTVTTAIPVCDTLSLQSCCLTPLK